MVTVTNWESLWFINYGVPIVSLLMDSWPSPQTGKFAHVLSMAHVDIAGTVEEATWGNDNRLLKALQKFSSASRCNCNCSPIEEPKAAKGWSSKRIIASWGHPSFNHMRLYLEKLPVRASSLWCAQRHGRERHDVTTCHLWVVQCKAPMFWHFFVWADCNHCKCKPPDLRSAILQDSTRSESMRGGSHQPSKNIEKHQAA